MSHLKKIWIDRGTVSNDSFPLFWIVRQIILEGRQGRPLRTSVGAGPLAGLFVRNFDVCCKKLKNGKSAGWQLRAGRRVSAEGKKNHITAFRRRV